MSNKLEWFMTVRVFIYDGVLCLHNSFFYMVLISLSLVCDKLQKHVE